MTTKKCDAPISLEEIAISNTEANPHISTGSNNGETGYTKQSTLASVHCATVSPHLLIEECLTGTGGFKGLASGTDAHGNKVRTYIKNKQSENFFIDKVEHGVFNNIFLPFCQQLITPIYSAGVNYDTNNEAFLSFVKSANGNKSSYNSIKSACGISAVAHQVSYVILDKSRTSDKVRMSYKRVNDVFQDCEDNGFGLDEDGELLWIGFLVDIKKDGTLVRHKHIVGAIEIQEKKTTSSQDKWETVEVRETGIDVLNVYPMFYSATQGGEFVPQNPDMLSIVFLLTNLYNLDTKVDYVMVQQAHGTLVISTSGEIVGTPDGLSNAIVLDMSPDGKASTADFLSIDASILTALLSASEVKMDKVLNLMGEKGVEAQKKGNQESGYSKEFDFMGKNAELLHGVEMFERLDEWVVEVWGKLTSDTTQFTVDITYANDFYPQSSLTIDELDVVWAIVKETNQTLLQQEILRSITTKVMKGRPHDKIQEVVSEHDNLIVDDELTGLPPMD